MEEIQIAAPVMTIPEYAKQAGSTYARVKSACESGIIPAYKTSGGQWRIIAKNDCVSQKVYERALQRIAYLEGKLKSLKAILDKD